MSTNHTTNYDLNQWEGTDKVLRTEFNDDNAKIDAALKANADAIAAEAAAREAATENVTRFTKLKDYIAPQGSVLINEVYTLEVDVSDINFAEWQYVHLDLYLKGTEAQAQVRVNDKTNSCEYVYPSSGFSSGGTGTLLHLPVNMEGRFADRITFHVGQIGDRQLVCTAGHMTGHCTDVNFSQFTKLRFIGHLQAGSRFIFWGEG